jgi:hypothetical protein
MASHRLCEYTYTFKCLFGRPKKTFISKEFFILAPFGSMDSLDYCPLGLSTKQEKNNKIFFWKTQRKITKELGSDHGIIIMAPCGNKIKVMRIVGTMVKSNLTAKWIWSPWGVVKFRSWHPKLELKPIIFLPIS